MSVATPEQRKEQEGVKRQERKRKEAKKGTIKAGGKRRNTRNQFLKEKDLPCGGSESTFTNKIKKKVLTGRVP